MVDKIAEPEGVSFSGKWDALTGRGVHWQSGSLRGDKKRSRVPVG